MRLKKEISMDINRHTTPKATLEVEPSGVAPPLWNPDAAGVWSLFLSPVFGSTLVLKNWQAIGDKARSKTGRIWLIVSIVMLIPTIFFPGLFGIIYIITWYFAWQRKQTKYVKEHWGKDYPRKSWTVPLLIGIVAFAVISFVLGFLSTLLQPT